jgi:hypothetical protein
MQRRRLGGLEVSATVSAARRSRLRDDYASLLAGAAIRSRRRICAGSRGKFATELFPSVTSLTLRSVRSRLGPYRSIWAIALRKGASEIRMRPL